MNEYQMRLRRRKRHGFALSQLDLFDWATSREAHHPPTVPWQARRIAKRFGLSTARALGPGLITSN